MRRYFVVEVGLQVVFGFRSDDQPLPEGAALLTSDATIDIAEARPDLADRASTIGVHLRRLTVQCLGRWNHELARTEEICPGVWVGDHLAVAGIIDAGK